MYKLFLFIKKIFFFFYNCCTCYSFIYNNSNPGAKTIEGDLWKALVEAKAVSKDNAEDPKKVINIIYYFYFYFNFKTKLILRPNILYLNNEIYTFIYSYIFNYFID